jgi:HEAT repeat protein
MEGFMTLKTGIHAVGAAAIISVLAAGGGTGCAGSGNSKPARDFNELIPRMMGALDKGTPEQAAANLFNVTSPDERRDAIAYLQTQKWGHDPPYMRAYELLTTDPHPMVRAQAMRALGTSYKESSGALLAKGLDDPDVQVRRDAAYGLITTWSAAAFPHLRDHVREDVDELVRGYCARALVHDPSSESIDALIKAISDSDAAVTEFAHNSLVAITGQDLSYDPKAWLTWYQKAHIMPAPGGVALPTRPG